MADTFKYLDNKEGKAQDFLKGKMSTVANASEGVIPGGDAYKKYGKMPSNDSKSADDYMNIGQSIDLTGDSGARTGDFRDKDGNGTDDRDKSKPSTTTSPTSAGADAYKDFDVDDKYKSGQWGSGKLSQQDLADQYGLDTSAAANKGDTAVWGTNRTGERVFLGNIDNSFRSNDDVIKAHLSQADSGEAKHGDIPESVSSDGDVIGAMLNMWDGGGGPAKEEGPAEKEPERTPIKHSEEIKEAKSRVRSYEDSVLSGELSNDIYGKSNDVANDNYMDDYQLNLNKGQVGAGSADSGEEASAVATDSFLATKKQDVKKEYQFQPK